MPDVLNDSAFNRPASTIKAEQEEELYYKLYPYIVDEFYHKRDIDEWVSKILAEINAINAAINQLSVSISAAFQQVTAAITASITAHMHLVNVVGAMGPSTGSTLQGIQLAPPVPPVITYTGKNVVSRVEDKYGRGLVTVSPSTIDGVPEKRRQSVSKFVPPFSITP